MEYGSYNTKKQYQASRPYNPPYEIGSNISCTPVLSGYSVMADDVMPKKEK